MRRLLVALVVLAIVSLALIAFLRVPRHGGPLSEVGNAFGGPVQAGHPFTANYELINSGGRAIEFRNVSLSSHSSGLDLLGARVQTSGTRFGGAWPGFPLARTTSVPVGAFVLSPHGEAPLQVGLQASKTGNYSLMGVDV